MEKQRVIFNEDSTHYLLTLWKNREKEAITNESLAEYVNQYKGTAVTDFFICINHAVSAAPSKTKSCYQDRALVKEERGEKVNYIDTWIGMAHEIWTEKGLDMFGIWIDALKEIGINPWLSFRMNDCHVLFEKASAIVPPEYYENFDKNSRIRHKTQFPFTVNSWWEPKFIKINTGRITGGNVTLNLGISGEINPDEDVEVYVNSTPARFVKTKACGYPVITNKTVYEFEVEKSGLSETVQVAEIIVKEGISIEVDYADIEITVN